MLLDVKGNLDGVFLVDFDQGEDATHQESGEHVIVLLKLDLDFDLVVLRIVLLLHVRKRTTLSTASTLTRSGSSINERAEDSSSVSRRHSPAGPSPGLFGSQIFPSPPF